MVVHAGEWQLMVFFLARLGILLGMGEALFGGSGRAMLFLFTAVECGGAMRWNLNRTSWGGLAEISLRSIAEPTGH